MGRIKEYSYVIDNLNKVSAEKLKTALESVNSIVGISISIIKGVLTVKATRNVYDEILLACEFAKVTMRTSVKKRGIFG